MELTQDRFSYEDNLRRKEETNRGLLIDEYDREFMGSWPDRYLTMDPEEVAKELEEAFEPITTALRHIDTIQQWVERLCEHEREEYEAAKERGYLIDRSTKRGNLWQAYMTWCAFINVPFVGVSTRSGFVQMWFTEIYKGFTRHGREEVCALFEKYGAVYTEPCSNVADARVLPEDGELLAREMLETILKPGVIDPPLDQAYSPPRAWLDEINRRARRGWS